MLIANANSQSPPIDPSSQNYTLWDSSPGSYLSNVQPSNEKRDKSGILWSPRQRKELSHSKLLKNIRKGQAHVGSQREEIGKEIFTRVNEFRFRNAHCDKIFSSCWLGSTRSVVTAGKDNRLIMWNVEDSSYEQISLPDDENAVQSMYQCGMHTVLATPDLRFLISGGVSPNDLVVFELPTFKALAICKGHTNWAFGATIWSSTQFLTCGRDQTICFWDFGHLDSGNKGEYRHSKYSQVFHQKNTGDPSLLSPSNKSESTGFKVRDICCLPLSDSFSAISPTGLYTQWDMKSFKQILKISTKKEESVVLKHHDESGLYAIGTRDDVTFIDSRIGEPCYSVRSQDQGWGVRSLAFNRDILAIGGGAGRVSLLDVRTFSYIPMGNSQNSTLFIQEKDCETSGIQYHTYALSRLNAVYTVNWSPDGTSLFCGGGPLQCGLTGSWCKLLY